jgi:hypothetical protein
MARALDCVLVPTSHVFPRGVRPRERVERDRASDELALDRVDGLEPGQERGPHDLGVRATESTPHGGAPARRCVASSFQISSSYEELAAPCGDAPGHHPTNRLLWRGLLGLEVLGAGHTDRRAWTFGLAERGQRANERSTPERQRSAHAAPAPGASEGRHRPRVAYSPNQPEKRRLADIGRPEDRDDLARVLVGGHSRSPRSWARLHATPKPSPRSSCSQPTSSACTRSASPTDRWRPWSSRTW